MEPVFIKTIAAIVTLIECLIFALLPLKLVDWVKLTENRERRFNFILSLLTCFSGGIFLGAVLIHLFPETYNDFNECLTSRGITTEYPVAFLVICLGLFLVLLMEKLVEACILNQTASTVERKYKALPPDDETSNNGNTIAVSDQKGCNARSVDATCIYDNKEKGFLLATNGPNTSGCLQQHGINNYQTIEEKGGIETSLSDMKDAIPPITSHQSSVDDNPITITSTIRSIVLLMALVFHSILEGLAIGLQKTEPEIYALFIAIVSHKFVEAFSLGLEIAQTVGMSPRMRVVSMVTFSTMTPIGVVIGMLIMNTGDGRDASICLLSSDLQALAAGSFLYVTFFEILPKELNKKRAYDLVRVLVVMVGFGFMAGIKLVEK